MWNLIWFIQTTVLTFLENKLIFFCLNWKMHVCTRVCMCVRDIYSSSVCARRLWFALVTEAVSWFKFRPWHVRCVQYIISVVNSWIAHLMLWMCQCYEVLSSDLMGSMSVDKLWPRLTHTCTHTRTNTYSSGKGSRSIHGLLFSQNCLLMCNLFIAAFLIGNISDYVFPAVWLELA